MGKKSVTKGKGFEREVVQAMRGEGIQARRMAPLQARQGDEVPDVEVVVTTPDWMPTVSELRPLVLGIECKIGARKPNPHSCWDQAVAAAGDRVPVVVSRETGNSCALATMRLVDLVKVLDVMVYLSAATERYAQTETNKLALIELVRAAERLGVVDKR